MGLGIRWYRKGEANPLEGVTKAGGSRAVATLSTLTIQPQKEDDGAEYRCVAWNRAMDTDDKKEATVSLTVNCKSSSSSCFFFLHHLRLLLLLSCCPIIFLLIIRCQPRFFSPFTVHQTPFFCFSPFNFTWNSIQSITILIFNILVII